MSRTGLSDVAIGCWQNEAHQRRRGTAMATVYVVTAGSGDSYRIERVYLDSDQAYGFAQDYNGIAPIEPVQVEEWQDGGPPAAYDGPYWRAQWWARDALPEATVVRRELTGAPKIEVVGRSKEKVEEIFWEAVTQARAELAGGPRK